MSTHANPTLLEKAILERDKTGKRAPFPKEAPIIEIAELLASDEFGQVDKARLSAVYDLLCTQPFKLYHFVSGTKDESPVSLLTVTAYSFAAPNFFGGGNSRGSRVPTCEEEARAKRQKANTPPPRQVSIISLLLSVIARHKPAFVAKGFWSSLADIVFGTQAEAPATTESVTVGVQGVTTHKLDEKLNEEQINRDVSEILKESGIKLPRGSMGIARLYASLEQSLLDRGYTASQIKQIKKNAKDLPKQCIAAGWGNQIPYEVVHHIFSAIQPKGHKKQPPRPSLRSA